MSGMKVTMPPMHKPDAKCIATHYLAFNRGLHTRNCNCSNYYDHVIGLSIRGAHDTSDEYNYYMVINSIINS